MRSMRLTRWSVVVVASGVALSGCATAKSGSGGVDTGNSGVTYDSKATLAAGDMQIMGFGGTDEVGATRMALATAAVAPAKPAPIKGAFDIQQFLSAVASGQPPQLVYAGRDVIGTLASRGAIISLDDCIKGEGIDTGAFRKTALDQVTFAGHVYGIPEFNQVEITMANANLLQAAGVSIDDVNGSDWDKITAAAPKLYKASGGKVSVIGYDSKLPEFLPLWAKANGADLLSADGKKAQLNDPKVVEALTFAANIYTEQGGFGAVKAFRDSADFFGKGNQFATGVLGAMPFEQWYLNTLNDVSPDAPMAFDTFKAKDGKTIAFSSGSAFAIPKNTKNPQAACRFMKTMTATDSWMAAAKARVDARTAKNKPFTGLLTGNKEADDKIKSTYVKTSGDAKWDKGITAVYDANENGFSLPANPAGNEFKTAMNDAVNRVLNGQAKPQESLDQAQTQAQAALDKAWAAFGSGK